MHWREVEVIVDGAGENQEHARQVEGAEIGPLRGLLEPDSGNDHGGRHGDEDRRTADERNFTLVLLARVRLVDQAGGTSQRTQPHDQAAGEQQRDQRPIGDL